MKTDIIYNCDCMDGFKRIPDESVNFIVTSPPYNLNIPYDSWDDNKPYAEYLSWCRQWLKECYRVLKDDGRIAINHYLCTANGGSHFPLMDFRDMQTEIGFNVHALAIWDETTLSKLSAFGSYKNSSAPNIMNPYEGILIAYKHQWERKDGGTDTITEADFREGVSGSWRIRPEGRGLTQANYPVELPRRCIELLSFKGDTVLDPFMGSGTTAMACIATGRRYVGFEISPSYYSTATARIADYEERHGAVAALLEY